MNRLLLLFLVLFLCLTTHLPAADDPSEGDDADSAAVAKALSKIHFLKGKPNMKAQYYIYLHSASWCPPCRKEMPNIVKTYPKLKKCGAEIILFGHDETEDGVVAYAKNYKAKFPLLKDSPEWASKVPGYRGASGIPHLYVVDQSGKLIYHSHPASFFRDNMWKKYISKKKADADSDGGDMEVD